MRTNRGDLLTYALSEAPDGMTIDSATGEIFWPTGESHGPKTYAVAVSVTDSGDSESHHGHDVPDPGPEKNLPPRFPAVTAL